MFTARKLAANTAIQIFGRFLTLIISVITFSFIANHLFVDGSALKGYGQYSIVLTYISIIGATADLGLFTLVVREITGLEPEKAGRVVGAAILFRFLLLIAALLILAGIFPFLPYDLVVKQGILLGAVVAFLMLFSQSIAAIFQATYQAEKIVISEVAGRLVMMGLTIYFLAQGMGLIPVILANLIGNVVLLGTSYLLSRATAPIKINFDWSFWRASLPEFWSIAVVTVLGLIHFRIDSLILSFYQPVTEVGIYGVAYRVLDIVLVVPAILAANLLPLLTGLGAAGKREEMARLVSRMTGNLWAGSIAIGAAVLALAPWVIVFITRSDFVASAVPLRMLVPALIFLFLTSLFAQAVISMKEQKRLIGGYALVIGLDVVFNLVLIPHYSYRGAAITTVASEAVLMIYSFYLLVRLLPLGLRTLPLGRMVAFAALMGALSYLAYCLTGTLNSQFELSTKMVQGIWLIGLGGGMLALGYGLFKLVFKGSAVAELAQ